MRVKSFDSTKYHPNSDNNASKKIEKNRRQSTMEELDFKIDTLYKELFYYTPIKRIERCRLHWREKENIKKILFILKCFFVFVFEWNG